LILGHNFPTTIAKKPINCSKDVDVHQVFKERNKTLPLAVGAQGQLTSSNPPTHTQF